MKYVGRTLLLLAFLAGFGNVRAMSWYRKSKEKKERIKHNTDLIRAVYKGDAVSAAEALKAGAFPDVSDGSGYTVFEIALNRALRREKDRKVAGLNDNFIAVAKVLARYGASVKDSLIFFLFEFVDDDGKWNEGEFANKEVLERFKAFIQDLRSSAQQKENIRNN